jgi:hypothetical protein
MLFADRHDAPKPLHFGTLALPDAIKEAALRAKLLKETKRPLVR